MKVFVSCSCQLSLLVSPFWFLPWRSVICYLSSLYDIFCLIIICCIFSTFWGESFQFNSVALLWHSVTSILLNLASVPLLLFFFLEVLSYPSKLRLPVILSACGHILYSLHCLWSVLCISGRTHFTFKFFFFFSGFWPIRWLPLAVNFQYNLAWWSLLASTFSCLIVSSWDEEEAAPLQCLPAGPGRGQPGFCSLATEALTRCLWRPAGRRTVG